MKVQNLPVEQSGNCTDELGMEGYEMPGASLHSHTVAPLVTGPGDRTSKVQRYPSTAACLEHSLPQESPFLTTHVCAHMQACMYTFSPTHTPFLQNKGDGEGVRRTEAG